MTTVILTLAVLATLTSVTSAQTTACKPDDNCNPPNCRCWNDEAIPGGIPVEDTPQTVLISFEYAINEVNIEQYQAIFQGTTNPNSCQAVGTFFVQETGTQMDKVKDLYDAGHEIGVTSPDGTSPKTEEEWATSLQQMRAAVAASGIPAADVVGVRAPELKPGGESEFSALDQQDFLYDASCTTSSMTENRVGAITLPCGTPISRVCSSDREAPTLTEILLSARNACTNWFDGDSSELVWPYTYDFAPGPECDYGEGPETAFPGRWQFLVADLAFNGTKCATPQACIDVATERDAFDMLYNSFIKHYEGTKSPFLIVINPDWALTPFKLEGTRQFVEYIRSAFEDTWILSMRQALDWVRNPVTNADATSGYSPWAC
ncbi:hypothetical protein BaRGS_00021138 [Batillaria attramentaria]|uniref:NodB homology domain-containing protein n=1 Tax=Batillaria attramentaria TaxID=370345 RepID=A0ABD0KKD8_9CAEN